MSRSSTAPRGSPSHPHPRPWCARKRPICGSLLGAAPSSQEAQVGALVHRCSTQRTSAQRSEMTPTRPATPTDPPDLLRKPLGAGRWRQDPRAQLNPLTDTTGDHHNDHRHPARAAAGPVDAATIADRYPIPASAPSFIVQTATAEHPSAPLDNGPPVLG